MREAGREVEPHEAGGEEEVGREDLERVGVEGERQGAGERGGRRVGAGGQDGKERDVVGGRRGGGQEHGGERSGCRRQVALPRRARDGRCPGDDVPLPRWAGACAAGLRGRARGCGDGKRRSGGHRHELLAEPQADTPSLCGLANVFSFWRLPVLKKIS